MFECFYQNCTKKFTNTTIRPNNLQPKIFYVSFRPKDTLKQSDFSHYIKLFSVHKIAFTL